MRNALTIAGGLAVFSACVAAAGLLTSPINEQRKDLNLNLSDDLYDLPPDQAVLQAGLGVFRGVGINAAWIRMEDLKNAGNYSEAVQLGEWITKLQPKFAQVWEFVSWNQAYNISVGTHTPEERWFWVRSGIDLLQREGGGIEVNPDALRLYQQLAWIYHHKVGMFQDQYNWYYKRAVAEEFDAILGEPPLDVDEYVAWLKAIDGAARAPADLSADARRLVDYMADAGYAEPIDKLRAFTVESAIAPDAEGESSSLAAPTSGVVSPELVPPEPMPEWASQEARDEAIRFLRRAAITGGRINMDVSAMIRDAEAMGAIDYRHPAGSSMYWARRGLERLEQDEGRSTDGLMNLRRQILNSLDQLARQGRVIFDPRQGYVSYTPDWPFWLDFERYYTELGEEELAQAREQGATQEQVVAARTERMYGSGFRNRMDAAIADAELYGDRETALELMARLGERYEGTPYAERYDVSLDEFLERQFAETLDNPDAARATMSALLVQALSARHLVRDEERAEALVERSRKLHGEWRERNPDPNDPLYQEVPDFPALMVEAYGKLLTGEGGSTVQSMTPGGQVPLGQRADIWRSLSEQEQSSIAQSNLGPEMFRQAGMAGYDPFEVFPVSDEIRDSILRKLISGDRPEVDDGVERSQQEIK